MGYENSYSGAITITPPLTRTQIRDSQIERMTDVRLRIVEQQIESDDGEAFTVRPVADAIVPLTEYSGDSMREEIQFLVDTFGEHEFAGFIEVRWDAGFGEPPSRFIVKDGRVVQIDAQFRWPGEWGDEPVSVSPAAREQIAAEVEAHAESIGWYEGGGVWAEALDVIRQEPWTRGETGGGA